jgi:hypothetical protein
MSDNASIVSVASATADVSPAIGTRAEPLSLENQFLRGWTSIAGGIVIAGASYPVVLGVIWLGFAMLISASLPPAEELISASFAFMGFSLVGAVIGLMWTAFVLAVVFPLVLLVVWSLKPRGNIIWFGAFCGGLIGFVAVLPFILAMADNLDGPNALEVIPTVLIAGPALTTVLGQLGGAWGGRRTRCYERSLAAASVGASDRNEEGADASFPAAGATSSGRLQFGIRHLLWVGVWISLLLSAIRLSGIPFGFALPLLMGWIAFQAMTLWIGGKVVPRVDAWWTARRQSRST